MADPEFGEQYRPPLGRQAEQREQARFILDRLGPPDLPWAPPPDDPRVIAPRAAEPDPELAASLVAACRRLAALHPGSAFARRIEITWPES